jgi:hypothetical protein
LAGEQKPSLSGGNETLSMLVVAFRLREFFFGVRSALSGGKQFTAPDHPAKAGSIANSHGRVWSKQNIPVKLFKSQKGPV